MKNLNNTDTSVDLIKSYLNKVFAIKYFYIICFIVLMVIAYMYNKHSHREYEVNASIGVVQYNASSVLASGDMFRGTAAFNTRSDVSDDAIKALTSFSLITSTITNMNLEVGYFMEENSFLRKTTDMHQQSPIYFGVSSH